MRTLPLLCLASSFPRNNNSFISKLTKKKKKKSIEILIIIIIVWVTERQQLLYLPHAESFLFEVVASLLSPRQEGRGNNC